MSEKVAHQGRQAESIEIDVALTPEEAGALLNVINNTGIRGIASMRNVLGIVEKIEGALEEKGLSVIQAPDAQPQGRGAWRPPARTST